MQELDTDVIPNKDDKEEKPIDEHEEDDIEESLPKRKVTKKTRKKAG